MLGETALAGLAVFAATGARVLGSGAPCFEPQPPRSVDAATQSVSVLVTVRMLRAHPGAGIKSHFTPDRHNTASPRRGARAHLAFSPLQERWLVDRSPLLQ